jgi:hypothetical protein
MFTASVATNGWIQATAIKRSLTTPSSPAAASPCGDSAAATTAPKASSAPSDRSSPPLGMANAIPSASSPAMLFCRRTLVTFSGVRSVS